MTGRNDTICAPATGSGGAIAVIRVSGPGSFAMAASLFSPADKDVSVKDAKGYTILFGEIVDGPEVIDEVLVSLYRSPRSYTGEDSVEISCHASKYIQNRILELLIKSGARAASPGEFTQRAFMNGKMDLSQAEAVADLISARSEASHRLALGQMRGGISSEISKLRSELLHFASLIELELDFGEEDVEFADRTELLKIISGVKTISDDLASSFLRGNAIKNGIPVAIIGKPNSGKSTLLNKLLKEERAIVSDIPGTTRDAIEDTIVIEGIEYRFIDTAGLRDTVDPVESIGISRTYEKISQAAIILLMDEVGDSYESITRRAENIRGIITGENKKLIIVINKADLATAEEVEHLRNNIRVQGGEKLMFISARNSEGIDMLKARLGEMAQLSAIDSGEVIITNIRHYEALMHVSESLERVETGIVSGIPEDLVALDIRQAIHYLGEITGEITTDEILGNIFKNFCIGK
ncbi:MAG TPA: tRNA uridine-5-carboxymethylaminomethyl(34) synthesis GTPase MnmE [Bacteroidales bacterium]|nr:tRNA uridine-5-carboxymethylaminomethyl(34) synthesis GTPase MnmE [Bacteroidales bacterium]